MRVEREYTSSGGILVTEQSLQDGGSMNARIPRLKDARRGIRDQMISFHLDLFGGLGSLDLESHALNLLPVFSDGHAMSDPFIQRTNRRGLHQVTQVLSISVIGLVGRELLYSALSHLVLSLSKLCLP